MKKSKEEKPEKEKKVVKKKGGLEPEQPLGLKQWIIKTILVIFLLMLIVGIIERLFHIPILVETMVSIIIVLSIGFTHEALHYMQAIKLGYQPKWYRTTFKMGFEIGHHSNRVKWMKDKKKIGRAPYIYLVPLSIIILIVGLLIDSLGLTIAGVGSLIMHAISYPSEGKES